MKRKTIEPQNIKELEALAINNIIDCKGADLVCDFSIYVPFIDIVNAGNMKALDIDARDISCRDISAGYIHAQDVQCRDISAKGLRARDVLADHVRTGNISCRDISCMDMSCRELSAESIISGNISAKEISAINICYLAVCFAEGDISCHHICGRRDYSRHFCLEGEMRDYP